MASCFSGPRDTKCLVPPQTLINPTTLSNLIRKGFAHIKLLYEMS